MGANKRRNVLKLAPDAIVFINGERFVPVGTKMQSKNMYNMVTSIQINASIDPSPNTASIELADPRTGDEPFFLNDTITTLAPFSEVEILMKGRFLHGGKPAYYPVFWGLISSVTKSYASGYHGFQLECVDMLRWYEIAQSNVNPSLIDAAKLPGVFVNVFTNRFHNMNPFEIINLCTRVSLVNIYAKFGKVDRTQGIENDKQTSKYSGDIQEVIRHWHDRFATLGTVVRCVGMDGVNIVEDSTTGKQVRETRGDPMQPEEGTEGVEPSLDFSRFDPNTEEIMQYKPYHQIGSLGDLLESEYKSIMDICAEAADLIGYEFFQDVTGEIIFKPPFWNMHTKTNKPISVIEDIDVISWSTTDSEREVQATRMDVFGSNNTWMSQTESKLVKPRATAIDYKLAMQYGIRPMTKVSSFWRTSQMTFNYGASEMDRMNVRRFSSSLSIPLRPELRLGYPIFVEAQNAYHYIHGITHSMDFEGMQAQTQLSLVATRRCFRTVTKNSSTDEQSNKKGGKCEGQKSQVMKVGGPSKPSHTRKTQTSGSEFSFSDPDFISLARMMEMRATHHEFTTQDQPRELASGGNTITREEHPVSDEHGYEVQGCFPYGRGISVSANGAIGEVTVGHAFEDAVPADSQENPALPPVDNTDSRTSSEYDASNPSNPGPRAIGFDGAGPGGA